MLFSGSIIHYPFVDNILYNTKQILLLPTIFVFIIYIYYENVLGFYYYNMNDKCD